MRILQQLFQLVGDSPTYIRDRANLISGFTVGITALLLNGAVLLFMAPFILTGVNSDGFTEMFDFGQLMGFVLLGGASTFATILIPLRLATVFWEPRMSRYFDQVILSGISPMRFVIGKAMSQNLFLGLILFLLAPYFVLSLTLGGINFSYFLACLFLVWLYCMSLAMATIWFSLYSNDLIAALTVIVLASLISFWGCMPQLSQYFLLSPFPALFQPIYSLHPGLSMYVNKSFLETFGSCAVAMTAFLFVAIIGLNLGPLYGIIKDNSTFGEVVRAGDSKRKSWLRIRTHIQRSSEIAFFYENRHEWFKRYETFIRWGVGFAAVTFFSIVCDLVIWINASKAMNVWTSLQNSVEFQSTVLMVHGLGVFLAAVLFSHSKNTTYLQMPVWRKWTITVSSLDTVAFLVFLTFSAAVSIIVPQEFERFVAIPHGGTVFPIGASQHQLNNAVIDCHRISWEGTAILSVIGVVVYTLHRTACLASWTKNTTLVVVSFLYFILVGIVPLTAAVMVFELNDLREIQLLSDWAPIVAPFSPIVTMGTVVTGQFSNHFPKPTATSTIPFYCLHAFLLFVALIRFRAAKRKLLQSYLSHQRKEASHV